MKKTLKKAISLLLVMTTLCSLLMLPATCVNAATKGCGYVVNVYDGGRNYSGRYQCNSQTSFGNVGILGKNVKIEFVNFCSVLKSNQVRFYNNYARFNVYVYSNGKLKKFYANKRIGDSFKVPSGKNITVSIDSKIDSSGWGEFTNQMKSGLPWTYAQYRIKY